MSIRSIFCKRMTTLFVLILTIISMAMCLMLSFATPAHSASAQTWLPTTFNENKHVYLDPSLDSGYRGRFAGVESSILEAQKQHKLSIYVVAVKQGYDDPPQYGQKFAPWKLDQLVDNYWYNNASFSDKDYLVVLIAQKSDDSSKFSVAANSGGVLRSQYNMEGSYFSRDYGPLMSAFNAQKPNNPKLFVNLFLNNLNASVDKAIVEAKAIEAARVVAEQRRVEEEKIQAERARVAAIEAKVRAEREAMRRAQQEREYAEFSKKASQAAPYVFLMILLGSGLIVCSVRYVRWRRRVRPLLAKWQEYFANASSNYMELESGYLGFLQQQGKWQERFQGQTRAEFGEAIGTFGQLSAAYAVGKERLDKAEVSSKQHWMMSFLTVSGYKKSVACLEIDEITISEEVLPLEKRSLFGGAVAITAVKPDALLDEMSALFDATNSKLAKIKAAFDGAEQNRKDIEALTADILKAKDNLQKSEFSLAPYDVALEEIRKGLDKVKELFVCDPLKAYALSEEVEASAGKLLAKMAAVATFNAKRVDAVKALDTFEQEVQAMRRSPKANRFPMAVFTQVIEASMKDFGTEETKRVKNMSLDDSKPMALVEKGGNPDQHLREAQAALSEMMTALEGADPEVAEAKLSAAKTALKRAQGIVEVVGKTKVAVESKVEKVGKKLMLLPVSISQAKDNLQSLESNFLPENFATEPKRIDLAKRILSEAISAILSVKKEYDATNYLTAQERLDDFDKKLDDGLKQSALVGVRLQQLTADRQSAADIYRDCRSLLKQIEQSHSLNSFALSIDVKSAIKDINKDFAHLKQEVAKTIADWPSLVTFAGNHHAALKSYLSQIEEQQRDYQVVLKRQADLLSIKEKAEREVAHDDVRELARRKLKQAKQNVPVINSAVVKEGNDWKRVAKDIERLNKDFAAVIDNAESDRKLASVARKAIRSASDKVRSTNRGYGHGVFASLGGAESSLRDAQSSLAKSDYEGAKDLADKAYRKADQAEDRAIAQVNAIVAEIERQAEEERRRRRRREEEEERRRESSYSSSSSSSSSSWSGGGSGGGGFDGGGSGGGGDF